MGLSELYDAILSSKLKLKLKLLNVGESSEEIHSSTTTTYNPWLSTHLMFQTIQCIHLASPANSAGP